MSVDSLDRIDIDTAFSLTSDVADATKRRAAVHAIAETLEVLEGSVASQIADLPDTASVATRFAWGNAPPTAADNPGGTAQVLRHPGKHGKPARHHQVRRPALGLGLG